VERARADLGRALDEARGQLRGSAQELAGQIATRVLGRPIS
jgi:F0F1-type ATP synthase membrane subunit b/b'